ncbi:cytidine deaminase-like protein [Rhexocercosporidium sp. MPI-PUGE-AT-0058]|nr:cytidine deaminase-like protein [Rhexocercosporidium sp. MPI-PUGE-AT-0058]
MLIGLCGAICSGKQTIADYLVQHHSFTQLHLQPESTNGDSLRALDISANDEAGKNTSKGKSLVNGANPKSTLQYTFSTADDLLDFVTKKWQELWVTTDVHSEAILDKLDRRPFFILVSVDGPIHVRWKRFQERMQTMSKDSPSLEEFVLQSDEHLYSSDGGLLPLISRATIKLLNTSSDLAHLYARLSGVNLLNNDRLRPTWDQYFMQLASLGAQRSNCMKRRVGCVIVEDKRVISTGYNGTPRGLKNCADGGCPRCNEGQSSGVGLGTCLCLHAEENALLEAGRGRIRKGTILYCDTCPCLTCSIKIAQVGISEVVYSQGYSMDGETADVFKQAGVRLRQFIPPANGMIHLER